MKDLGPVLIYLLFALFLIVKGRKKKAAQRVRRPVPARAFSPAAPVPEPGEGGESFEAEKAEPEQAISEQAEPEPETFGGSMPYTFEEGERPETHEAHMRRSEDHGDPKDAPRINPARLSAAEMRRAVVTAEILDRPVALRRQYGTDPYPDRR